jgi:hypothetical protein
MDYESFIGRKYMKCLECGKNEVVSEACYNGDVRVWLCKSCIELINRQECLDIHRDVVGYREHLLKI